MKDAASAGPPPSAWQSIVRLVHSSRRSSQAPMARLLGVVEPGLREIREARFATTFRLCAAARQGFLVYKTVYMRTVFDSIPEIQKLVGSTTC